MIALPLLLIAALAPHVWAWRRLGASMNRGVLTKAAAIGRYAGWAAAPLVLLVAGYFVGVGLEEWLGRPLISESAGRAMPFAALALLAIGLIGWLGFAVRCAVAGPVPAARR